MKTPDPRAYICNMCYGEGGRDVRGGDGACDRCGRCGGGGFPVIPEASPPTLQPGWRFVSEADFARLSQRAALAAALGPVLVVLALMVVVSMVAIGRLAGVLP